MSEANRPPAGVGILIVDDHPPMIRLVSELLAGAFPSQPLRTAESAAQAIELCKCQLPLVVVVDIGLPNTNGIVATRQIKDLSTRVAVVMHSSYDQPIFREQSTAAGADAFVSKTRTYAELVSTILKFLPPDFSSPGTRDQPQDSK